MYISTSHNVGETVYVYDKGADSVTRCKVISVTHVINVHGQSTDYRYQQTNGFTFTGNGDDFHSAPDLAFYRNPLVKDEPAVLEVLEPEAA